MMCLRVNDKAAGLAFRCRTASSCAATNFPCASGTDTALAVDPPWIRLERFEQVYYATTVPSSWKWYGD